MSLLRKIPTILGAGGGSDWRQHLQPCEYIETDGNCYILTDFKINTEKDFALKMHTSGGGYNVNLFGCVTDYTHKNFSGHYVSNGTGRYIAALSGTHELHISSGAKNYIFKINHTSNRIELCDFNNVVESKMTIVNFTTTYAFCLFALNNAGDVNSVPALSESKIYYCEHSDIFNLISCYVIDEYKDNKGNLCGSGVAGMVDTLTGIFYTNDGTGTFSHGADINI